MIAKYIIMTIIEGIIILNVEKTYHRRGHPDHHWYQNLLHRQPRSHHQIRPGYPVRGNNVWTMNDMNYHNNPPLEGACIRCKPERYTN